MGLFTQQSLGTGGDLRVSGSATARGFGRHFLHLESMYIRDGETYGGRFDGEWTEYGRLVLREHTNNDSRGLYGREEDILAVVRGGCSYPALKAPIFGMNSASLKSQIWIYIMNGTSWADQWDNSAKGGRIGGGAINGGGTASNSKTAKYKEKLGQGLDKTKAAASSGFKKLKTGSASKSPSLLFSSSAPSQSLNNKPKPPSLLLIITEPATLIIFNHLRRRKLDGDEEKKKMAIEMPRGLPFSVDTFGANTTTKRMKRHHFLTHAHKDHTVGISPSNVAFPIYSTSLTISLLLQRHPQLDDSFFVRIEIGQTVIVDDPDGGFKVTAFDANHCPGAVMFLFEGSFGNILHTGDCRLTPECLQSLPEKYVGRRGNAPKCCLDYVFLDCTFGKSTLRFPTKHSAIRQIINCIWNHPDAPRVYLACDMLGQEDILSEVSRTFGSKIYVDKATNSECFRSLTVIAPEIVSQDPSSRFHIFSGFPRLYERASAKLAEARSKRQSEPLIIRPSAQWYVCDDGEDDYSESVSQVQKQRKVRFCEAVRDEFGVWHVCYSMHSSRDELESAMRVLSPRWVVSTVSSCRAMELDYVKRNCFISRFSSDDPFWKLLDIDMEVSSVSATDTQTITLSCCLTSAEDSVIESSTVKKQLLSLSPEKNNLPVTLFGRARLSSQVSDQLHERKVVHSACVEALNLEEVAEYDTKQETIEEVSCRSFSSSSSSSKESCSDLSGELRKLYRSMNAPVPRPLPSLMELMNARKRYRKSLNL
ncbi:hypothetical protein Bca4012_055810 [Brassica carinata]